VRFRSRVSCSARPWPSCPKHSGVRPCHPAAERTAVADLVRRLVEPAVPGGPRHCVFHTTASYGLYPGRARLLPWPGRRCMAATRFSARRAVARKGLRSWNICRYRRHTARFPHPDGCSRYAGRYETSDDPQGTRPSSSRALLPDPLSIGDTTVSEARPSNSSTTGAAVLMVGGLVQAHQKSP